MNSPIYNGKVDPHFATKAIHAGKDKSTTAVIQPISISTTFIQPEPGIYNEYCYGRSSNPTRKALEKCIAALENGKHGFCFSSGMAALDTVTHLLKGGDHVICGDDVYGGTSRYFRKVIDCVGVEVTFVDTTDVDRIRKAIQNNTRMLWLETPSNPMMKLSDIEEVASVLKQHDIICVVDNTFMTPYFQQPLLLGADIVVHSLTKYMNGHCDVIMGAVVTNRDDLYERIKFLQNSVGAVPSPMDCFLVHRGLKTLPLRMREHMRNGLAIARFLETHPSVEKVLHPGLPSHPQHNLALKQTSGYSGMISFYLKGGFEESNVFLKNLKVFVLAESLGGSESLAQLPALMTHASVPKDHKDKLGITDNYLRLSVGLETTEDLIEDLDQALRAAVKTA